MWRDAADVGLLGAARRGLASHGAVTQGVAAEVWRRLVGFGKERSGKREERAWTFSKLSNVRT